MYIAIKLIIKRNHVRYLNKCKAASELIEVALRIKSGNDNEILTDDQYKVVRSSLDQLSVVVKEIEEKFEEIFRLEEQENV